MTPNNNRTDEVQQMEEQKRDLEKQLENANPVEKPPLKYQIRVIENLVERAQCE